MSLKMAPIKIHIKSSSADIAEQPPAEAVPSSGSEASGKELTDTATEGASDPVKDTKDAGLELTTEAESADKEKVSAEDPTADKQSEKDGGGDAKQVPDQDKVDSDLYEYEGDDVYFTNPTTKGMSCPSSQGWKKPVFFFLTQPSGFFWVFLWFFLGFFVRTRGFLGFFSVSRILLGASTL
jgi:hypothetical protein